MMGTVLCTVNNMSTGGLDIVNMVQKNEIKAAIKIKGIIEYGLFMGLYKQCQVGSPYSQ